MLVVKAYAKLTRTWELDGMRRGSRSTRHPTPTREGQIVIRRATRASPHQELFLHQVAQVAVRHEAIVCLGERHVFSRGHSAVELSGPRREHAYKRFALPRIECNVFVRAP